MPTYTTADLRNILLVGHGGSGKTTLADALLTASGGINRKCSVPDGTSVCDYEKEEKEHKHSIYPHFVHCDWQGKRINLIDTPGSPDLIGQSLACLPAVETVAVVINAQNGIEVITRRLMEAAKERNLPRAIIINRIDIPEIDLEGLVKQIQETFGRECLPINLPAKDGKAVLDCLLSTDGTADFDTVKRCHAAILDQIVEMDENLMEKYLGGEEPNYDVLHPAFEKAMDASHVVPICFTNARDGVGVKELLDIIVKHYPSPLEGNLRPFVTGEKPEDDQPFNFAEDAGKTLLAHVFKVATDPFIGKLAIFRVHQGKATGQSQVFIGHSKKPVKLSHVFHLQGKDHNEADAIIAGDIGAVAKIDEIHMGDVLHDDHALDFVHLQKEALPTPMYGLAVTPKNRADEQKISGALHRIVEEDPTFRVLVDRQTHELVIYGMGELHLRLILERLRTRAAMDVETKPPKIAYKETISTIAEGHHRHKKQTGGAGQFGEVYLRIEPMERGSGFQFVDEIFGGTIPGQYVPAVEKGVRDLLEQGPVAGYPVQDVRVVVYDGKHHPVDSKEVAFRTAGKYAFKDAIMKARPVLLEPIVNMIITAPEDKVGAITGDLSGKRGRIQGTDILPGGQAQIMAQAPLSEVMQYQSQLKSVTAGQGSFTMELSHYDPVPPQVQQQIAGMYKPKVEEE